MRCYAIRLSTLAISATVAVPLIMAADVEASGRHPRKHQRMSHHQRTGGFNESWAGREFRPTAPSWSARGEVCPGNARGIDCRIWPPPIDDDPDRKASSDGM